MFCNNTTLLIILSYALAYYSPFKGEGGEESEQASTLGDSDDDSGDDEMEESDSSEEYQQVFDQNYGESSGVDSDIDEEQDFGKPLYPHLGYSTSKKHKRMCYARDYL